MNFSKGSFLAAPILREVWPALFEMFQIQDWYGQTPYDWNEFVFEVHEQNSQESPLYILASILPLFASAISFVLQEPVSQHFPIQRVWIKLHLLLELLDVSRKDLLCRNVTLDSTFFCARTLLQVSLHLFGSEMNLTLSFSLRSVLASLSCDYSGGASISRAESQVDVMLGLWKNIGVSTVLFISMISLGSNL